MCNDYPKGVAGNITLPGEEHGPYIEGYDIVCTNSNVG